MPIKHFTNWSEFSKRPYRRKRIAWNWNGKTETWRPSSILEALALGLPPFPRTPNRCSSRNRQASEADPQSHRHDALTLLGKEYEVFVKEYESFGESCFTLRLNKGRKKTRH